MTTPRSCAVSETLIPVDVTGTSDLLGRTQPHNLSLGGIQPESADLQPSLDVDETRIETYDGCLSVPGRSADLRIVGILVQVEAMTSDNDGQLSCVEKIQQRAQYGSLRIPKQHLLRSR